MTHEMKEIASRKWTRLIFVVLASLALLFILMAALVFIYARVSIGKNRSIATIHVYYPYHNGANLELPSGATWNPDLPSSVSGNIDYEVPSASAIFDDVRSYLANQPTTALPTISSYAPQFVIESETIKVDIQRQQVIVSVRASPQDYWQQFVRGRRNIDALIEATLLNHLKGNESHE